MPFETQATVRARRARPPTPWLLACASLACCLAGCEGSADSIASQLRGCELIDEGFVGRRIENRFYAPDDCYRGCLAGASCEELEASLCGTSIELEVRCDRRCAFRCGDGSLIGVERECDGVEQCPGGEDETACSCSGDGCGPERLRCANGDEYYAYDRCNGRTFCPDGSDEQGCFEHRCDDGEIVVGNSAADIRCNGWSQCRDGSDEMDCAAWTLGC